MKRLNAVLCKSLVRPFRFRSLITGIVVSLLMIFTLFLSGGRVVEADTSIGNVPAGTSPYAVAVNPMTNKIYVANQGGNVTVIDGTNNSTTTVGAGSVPIAVAVNPVTNKIYVANCGSSCNGVGAGNVTVINGTNNSTTTVAAGTPPYAIAVNPVTNKIYVANQDSNNVTVIDGTNNSTTTVATGTAPFAVAVNPVTNRIYVANISSANVTVIDGTNNSTTTVAAGSGPRAVAVDPATNKIYITNGNSNNVTVIDGSNNSTTAVAVGLTPISVAVNPVTNKIYVANANRLYMTVIDGTDNSAIDVATGIAPFAVAVNPVTNKIYVGTNSGASVTVIDGTNNSTTTVATGTTPAALAVNPVTNKIYVPNNSSSNVTVIDGSYNTTATVGAGTIPQAVAVNPVTNKIYVANDSSNNVTVIDGTNNTTTAVLAGTGPQAVAVNPVTNKIYVVNYSSNNVTVIDGTNNATTTVGAGTNPSDVALNPVTNKIYVVNYNSNNVTVIDGTNNATTTVGAGTRPRAVAVNPVTNKIYVANYDSYNVTVIDGTNNATTTVPAGASPQAIAVNSVTNKIYVANSNYDNVTAIDGTNNATTTIPAGAGPWAIAVNPATNQIYVSNGGSNNVTVIDGTNNATTTVVTGSVGSAPWRIAVNPMTNKIYVANYVSNNVTVIDGTNNATTTVLAGTNPNSVAVNPVTNKIYVAKRNSSNVTVITPAPTNPIPLNTTAIPLAGNMTASSNPAFTLAATSTYSPTAPPPQHIYFQMDTANGTWTRATNTGSTATTLTATAIPGALQNGVHILYFFASDGSDATSINPRPSPLSASEDDILGDASAPESSPVIGGINAYLFLVNAAVPCSFGITPNPQNFSSSGGTGSVAVSTENGCAWNAFSNDSWITVTGGSTGTGNGLVSFNVQATDGPARTGTITTAGQTFTVNQSSGCTYSISPTSTNIPASGANGNFSVTTVTGCAWTAVSNDAWITVTGGSSGSGNGTVSFNVQSTNGPARTGTITAAGQTFTVNQSSGCTYSISPGSTNVSSSGGNGSTNVATAAGCVWTAVSNDAWITITGGSSGNGSGTVSYNVQSTNGPARTGTITAAGQTFTVNQASGCTYSLNPTGTSMPSNGGSGSFAVSTPNSACGWMAISNNSWITITGGSSGTGNGTVFYTAQANTGPARTGTITAGGQTFTINQANGCTYSISPTSTNIAASGANSSFSVTTGTGCAWTGASNDAWITVTGGSSGSGNGTVSFNVQSTNGPARTGTITAAGQTFTVNQASGCTFSILPTSTNVSAAAGTGLFSLTTVSGCGWTAVSNAPWIAITGGSSGTGSGDISFSFEANTLNPRSGTITAGGRTFTVNQASGCTFSLSASSANIGASGGTGGFSINGIPACNWTAVRNDTWITITGSASGSGSGNISFSVSANTGPSRTGTITAGGQTFTVNQANGCTFAFAPTGTTFAASGGVGGFNVTTNSACIWAAISNAVWITVNSGAGTGNGSVTFTVQGNNGAARAGEISVATQVFAVNQLAPPSLVSVSGRVTTPAGLGLRNAVVAITDQAGVRRTATTSSFGFYSFENVRSGEAYIIGVSSKRYRFASRSVSVSSDLTGVDFIGLE